MTAASASEAMSQRRKRRVSDPITAWLLMVAALVFLMILVGGFVRLSRAGLSIVEWDVVTGIVPPIGEDAWQQSFADYQQTPEYRLVNEGMTLAEYQRIFYIEWAHRLIARLAGLLVVAPLLWFLRRRVLTVRASLPYWGIAALFGIQGAIGWVMVSSGLRDRPAVSHFRLTIHLLTALALLGLVLWMAWGRMEQERTGDLPAVKGGARSRLFSWALLSTVVVQIAYGGLVAGLKAGHVSSTWPLMFGQVVPPGLLSARDPWWINLVEAVGAHWVHRWFAFAVIATAVGLVFSIASDHPRSRKLHVGAAILLMAIGVQIALGVSVIVFGVPKWLAIAHQGVGVILFVIALWFVRRLRSDGQPAVAPAAAAVR